MPGPPLVRVVDPGDAGEPRDVLDGGEPREPRVPGRWRAAALVLVLLLAGGAVAASSIAEDRAEQRARDEAFAVLDEVHLRGELGAVHSSGPGALSAEVEVSAAGGERGGDRVTGLRLEGAGLTPHPPDLSGLVELPATVRPESAVDCERVASGRYPETVSVVLDVVPRSGVTRSQRMPVPSSVVREASLQACELPDPDARTVVEVQGAADGTLLLYLEPVPRSTQGLVLESVSVPGFDVRPVQGTTLPTSLPVGHAALYGFHVRVSDCATARGSSDAVVRLRVGDVRETRVASTGVSQPQPGGLPAAQLLRRLVDGTC